jgi:hypothetical protein
VFSGLPTSWDPNADGIVYAIAVSGGTVYAGGDFLNIGGQPRNRIAAINASGLESGLATSWDPNASGTVRSLSVSGGSVYAGGAFTTIGVTTTRNYIAAIDVISGLPTTWDPNASDAVNALAVDSSVVYVGGDFTRIGDQPLSYFGRLTP